MTSLGKSCSLSFGTRLFKQNLKSVWTDFGATIFDTVFFVCENYSILLCHDYTRAGMEQEVLTNLQNTNASGIRNNFNRVQWKTANAVGDLQNSVRSGNITEFCIVHLQVSTCSTIQ